MKKNPNKRPARARPSAATARTTTPASRAPNPRSRKASSSSAASPASADAGRRIDRRIAELGDWRGRTLARVRSLIAKAVPRVVEEWKWNVPVWSGPSGGIICTGETYKSVVKLTFARGASVPDPRGLFNSSLAGKTRRAIDLRDGDEINEPAFLALVRAAATVTTARAATKTAAPATKPARPRLLSGGNPQIAKADGDAPVQAYIAAMSGGGPGWKRDIGRRLDILITRTVPNVRKAVKWNSPFYGAPVPSDGAEGAADAGDTPGWFLSFHCFERYVKVAFFRGASLRPLPPGESKQRDVRYLDLREGEWPGDEVLASWIEQAARLPGWVP